MQILETSRLILRKFSIADAPFILELLNTPGWLQFIGDRQIGSLENAEQYLLTGPLQSYQKRGFGLYLVRMKDEELPIGMCGFLQRDYLPDPDIGYAFLPSYEGKGYAFESASATLTYGRKNLDMEKIMAITRPDNIRSVRLLEKLGFFAVTHLAPADGSLLFANEAPAEK